MFLFHRLLVLFMGTPCGCTCSHRWKRPGKSLDEVRLELDRRVVLDAKPTSVKRDLIGWLDAKETATGTNRVRLLNAPVRVAR